MYNAADAIPSLPHITPGYVVLTLVVVGLSLLFCHWKIIRAENKRLSKKESDNPNGEEK